MTANEFYDYACGLQPFDLPHNPVGFKIGYGADMTAHLPLLKFLASQCNHVTEFGLREGFSTAALLTGLPVGGTLVSYDIAFQPGYYKVANLAFGKDLSWFFYKQDTIEPGFVIQETDFLFIDDLHTYDQVKTELERHGDKVKKYLGFHDTYSQGERSLDRPSEVGILPAIKEYTANGWKLVYDVKFNHGLQIYERK